MSQFLFLRREWPDVYEAAARAEANVHADPRTACFYARRTLELAVAWALAKARAFLREHLDHIAVHKLRTNKPLTASDLAELERMLTESGVAGAEDIRRAAEESQSLGLFERSLVGLDRGAAKEAMAGFLADKRLSANQIEFINLIVDHLTEHGIVEPGRLYESPFTDLTSRGPDGIFTSAQIDDLMRSLEAVRATAVAA